MGNSESAQPPATMTSPNGADYRPPPGNNKIEYEYEVTIDSDTPIPVATNRSRPTAAEAPARMTMSQIPETTSASELTTTNNPQHHQIPPPISIPSTTTTATATATTTNNSKHHHRSDTELSQHPFGGQVQSQHGISDLPFSCRSTMDRGRFESEERRVRSVATHNCIWLAAVNGYSALLVFVFHLISVESLVSIALSVGLTVFTYYKTESNGSFDGGVLDWVLLSFAVITPLTTSIGMAFSRRERALGHLVSIRTTMLELYSAHACWDWRKVGVEPSGRAKSTTTNWREHSDAALMEILGICHSLSRFLTLPNATRARHRITSFGNREACQTLELASKLYGCILVRFGRLTDLCEVLKAEGLPPNEATRVRQWERIVLEHTDGLRIIKLYRTPQALRSFARLFTVFLPPFYAPSYAEIARGVESLGMGIAFSVLTSLALTALFETISQMEDPFLGYTSLDGVDVESELSSAFVVQCLTMRAHFFRDAPPFDEKCVQTTICEKLPVRPFTLIKSTTKKWATDSEG